MNQIWIFKALHVDGNPNTGMLFLENLPAKISPGTWMDTCKKAPTAGTLLNLLFSQKYSTDLQHAVNGRFPNNFF